MTSLSSVFNSRASGIFSSAIFFSNTLNSASALSRSDLAVAAAASKVCAWPSAAANRRERAKVPGFIIRAPYWMFTGTGTNSALRSFS